MREPAEFRRKIDSLFDSFFGTEREGSWCPDIHLTETSEEIIVKADIPGIDKKDLNVTASGKNLVIKGERKEGLFRHLRRPIRRRSPQSTKTECSPCLFRRSQKQSRRGYP